MITAPYLVYAGSRTTRERNARGEGLTVWRADPGRSEWTRLQTLGELVNPSFLAFDRSRRFLYAVHGDRSEISAFAIDAGTGLLTQLNQQSTQGRNPVHLAVDPSNRFVVVANHLTSSVVVLPIRDDGSLGEVVDLYQITGQIGPHRVEQPFAKPHQVEFDRTGRFIAVPDKGLDRSFIFRLTEAGTLEPVSACVGREGSGPRHIAFAPCNRFAWIINELDSTVTACRFDAEAGQLQPLQILSTLPDSYTGNSRAAEIVVSADGRFVYASNRGFDSVARFAVDAQSGRLASAGWIESGGRTPRFIAEAPDGTALFVANEDSDSIIRFQSDQLLPAGLAARTGSPVCLIFRAIGADETR